jgi:hypothetical protein
MRAVRRFCGGSPLGSEPFAREFDGVLMEKEAEKQGTAARKGLSKRDFTLIEKNLTQ